MILHLPKEENVRHPIIPGTFEVSGTIQDDIGKVGLLADLVMQDIGLPTDLATPASCSFFPWGGGLMQAAGCSHDDMWDR